MSYLNNPTPLGKHTDVADVAARDALTNNGHGDTVEYQVNLTVFIDAYLGGVWKNIETRLIEHDFEMTLGSTGGELEFNVIGDVYVEDNGTTTHYPSTAPSATNVFFFPLGANVVVKGVGVTSFLTVNHSSITSIHLDKNDLQLNASNMFKGVTMSSFTVGDDAFKNTTNFTSTWQNCTNLSSFPVISVANATSLTSTWHNCNQLTAFPVLAYSGDVVSFTSTWQNCLSLLSFPSMDTSSGVSFTDTWRRCLAMTTFNPNSLTNATSLNGTWRDCEALTSLPPTLNTTSVTSFNATWLGCKALTSFPSLNVSSGQNFTNAWRYCESLTSFPLLNVPNATSFKASWGDCTGLVSFPLLILPATLTTLEEAWLNCSTLSTIPLMNTNNVTSFQSTFTGCTGLTSVPLLGTSSGLSFRAMFLGCTGITNLPAFSTSAGTNFKDFARGCTSLGCLSTLDTTNQTDTTDMFANTPLLTQPTPAEQTALLAGSNYVNANTCGSYTPVIPNTAPVLTLVGGNTALSIGDTYNDQGATASDTQDDDVVLTNQISVSIEKLGEPSKAYVMLRSVSAGTATFNFKEFSLINTDTGVELLTSCVHLPLNADLAFGDNMIDGDSLTSLTGGVGAPTDVVIGTTSGITFAVTEIPLNITLVLDGRVYSGAEFELIALDTAESFSSLTDAAVSALPWVTLTTVAYTASHGTPTIWNDVFTGVAVPDGIDGVNTVVGNVDTSQAGSYTYSYNVTDSAGLDAVEVTRSVTVT